MNLELSLLSLGEMIYTIPAGFFIYFSRSVFHEMLQNRILGEEKEHVWESIDIFALGVFFIYGISWGGMLRWGKRKSFLLYVFSQFFYLILIALSIIYFQLKNPVEGSYLFYFSIKIVQYLIGLFLLNFIPLPPFDASMLYWPLHGQFLALDRLNTVFKLSLVLTLVFGWVSVESIISRQYILEWIQ